MPTLYDRYAGFSTDCPRHPLHRGEKIALIEPCFPRLNAIAWLPVCRYTSAPQRTSTFRVGRFDVSRRYTNRLSHKSSLWGFLQRFSRRPVNMRTI
jgi:hypothetical protein